VVRGACAATRTCMTVAKRHPTSEVAAWKTGAFRKDLKSRGGQSVKSRKGWKADTEKLRKCLSEWIALHVLAAKYTINQDPSDRPPEGSYRSGVPWGAQRVAQGSLNTARASRLFRTRPSHQEKILLSVFLQVGENLDDRSSFQSITRSPQISQQDSRLER